MAAHLHPQALRSRVTAGAAARAAGKIIDFKRTCGSVRAICGGMGCCAVRPGTPRCAGIADSVRYEVVRCGLVRSVDKLAGGLRCGEWVRGLVVRPIGG